MSKKSDRKHLKKMFWVLAAVITITLGVRIYVWTISHPSYTQDVDLTQNIEVIFRGADGDGTAEVRSNDLTGLGEGKDTLEWIEDLEYSIEPAQGLSNGDLIKVTVKYDERQADKLGIKVVSDQKEFVTENLVNTSDIHESKNSLGMDVEVIDGIDVPKMWDLSEEGKLEYVQSQKKAQTMVTPDDDKTEADPAETIEWQKGEGREPLDEKSFTNYGSAYQYGLTGSQRFRIVTESKDGSLRYYVQFAD